MSQGSKTAYGYVDGVLQGGARTLAAGAGAGAVFGGIAQGLEDLGSNLSPGKRLARIAISAVAGALIAGAVTGVCEAASAGLATPACIIAGAFVLGTVYDYVSGSMFDAMGLGVDGSATGGYYGGSSSYASYRLSGALC